MSLPLTIVATLCAGGLLGASANYLVLVPATFATAAFAYFFSEKGSALPIWLSIGLHIFALQAAYLICALFLKRQRIHTVRRQEREPVPTFGDAGKVQKAYAAVPEHDPSTTSQACVTGRSAAPDA